MPPRPLTRDQKRWIRIWLALALLGALAFVIGVEPDVIGMDRSPVVGFVQVGVWLFGLALTLLSLYASVRVVRNARPHSLRADIGSRLIATGYVLAAASSLADFISIGSHRMPEIFFGPLQTAGLVIGVVISLLGVVLYWPWRLRRKKDEAAETAPEAEAEEEPASSQESQPA